MAQVQLKGKLLIGAVLTVKTGLHIGDSSDFAPIGAVDSPFIRDPLTKAPIIPGSSLKGKMRTLLAKVLDEKVVKMGKQYRISAVVSVAKDALYQELVSAGVIKGLNNGF